MQLFLGEDPLDDQFLGIGDLVPDLGHPEGGMQIPQPPFSLLEIRLQDIDAGAVLLQPFLPLLNLVFDEAIAPLGDDLAEQHLLKLTVEYSAPDDLPGLKKSGPHRGVGLGHLHAVGRGPDRIPHIQTHVPEEIENLIGNILHPARGLAVVEEHQVDVRIGVEFAPSVPPQRHESKLGRGAGLP